VSKHTPGPWKAYGFAVQTQSCVLIAHTGICGNGLLKETNEANAKLLAEAPCMLSVLRDVAENTVSLELRAKVYAVIQQATGERS